MASNADVRRHMKEVGVAVTAEDLSELFGDSVKHQLSQMYRAGMLRREGKRRSYAYTLDPIVALKIKTVVRMPLASQQHKPRVEPFETVESFLARGGKIERLRNGEVSRPLERITE